MAGESTDLSPGLVWGEGSCPRAAASAKVCAWRQVLIARALCPCSAGPSPEPSFPLYLEVLAPYVNQVNLIRAGVPKIVSTVPSLLPGQRLPREAARSWGI